MIRKLRVIVKLFFARFMLFTEICHRCGRQVAVYWHTTDDLWARVTGWQEGQGILCMRCFDDLALEKDVYLKWTAQEDQT